MFKLAVEEPPKEEIPADVNEILGDTTVKPYEDHVYALKIPENGNWTITLPATKNKEVEDVIDYTVNDEDNSITVTWYYTKSGSYILHYGDMEKTVLVESMF
jgi:hypothetical protein